MKKVLVLFVFIVSLFMLVGCDKGADYNAELDNCSYVQIKGNDGYRNYDCRNIDEIKLHSNGVLELVYSDTTYLFSWDWSVKVYE